jgi:hypothetical protein
MKNFQDKKLSRDEAKNVLGGVRNPADDCPPGTYEYTCVITGGDLSHLTYVKYCIPNGQPTPGCFS